MSDRDVFSASPSSWAATPRRQGSGPLVGRGVERRRPLPRRLLSVADFAAREFGKSFLLTYNVRAGISLSLRIIGLLRRRRLRHLVDLQRLVGEDHLVFREDAARLAICLGGFVGLFQLVKGAITELRGRRDGVESFAAGAAAGVTALALDAERRRGVALYVCVRALQSVYNASKARGWWHFWGSSWNHGDTLLFSLCCGSIMYAYVMRPATLPASYNRFIVQTGPIRKEVLLAVRNNCRGLPVDVEAMAAHCRARGTGPVVPLASPFPAAVPCSVLHPQRPSCVRHNADVFSRVFRRILPLYLSLTFVPMLALRHRTVAARPISSALWGTLSAARSTTFLSAFVAAYQAFICAQRRVASRDHRVWYYLAGVFAGLALLIERKSRRAELTLYALPRALDSLFQLLVDRRLFAAVPRGEVAMCMLGTGALCYCYDHERRRLAPFIANIMSLFLRSRPGDAVPAAAPVGASPPPLSSAGSPSPVTTPPPSPLPPPSLAPAPAPATENGSHREVDSRRIP